MGGFGLVLSQKDGGFGIVVDQLVAWHHSLRGPGEILREFTIDLEIPTTSSLDSIRRSRARLRR